jgi:hypothetical protein
MNSNLFTTDDLEQFKDDLSVWWRQEKKRMDVKRTIEVLRRFFGITKKEAIEIEYFARNDEDKFMEKYLEQVLSNFEKKLLADDEVVAVSVKMSCQDGAVATILFRGETYLHDVPGHCGIIGTVLYQSGKTQSIFQKWISHPFWQYHNLSS